MLKSLTALAILALLGASVVALPYISKVEAGETVALAKGDRLDVAAIARSKFGPISQSHCLRGDQSVSEVGSL